MSNNKRELQDFIEEFYYPLERDHLKNRIHSEDVGRGRNPFQRDYSRILYSSSFRSVSNC